MAETTEGGGDGSLFQGKQFWLSQNIPQRSRFKELIAQHGGIVRLLEKDADIKLVDHTKKNLPPDTYSYQYVEASIRHGRLVSLEAYKAGPSAVRPVGATNIPTRSVKVGYSLQEDQQLWDWMQQFERIPGYPINGNKVYQDLAGLNPKHTFQSYRSRYLRKLRGHPRPGGMAGSTHRPPETHNDTNNNRAPAPAPAPAPVTTPPTTTDERPPQRTESDISKQDDSRQDDRKRKRSPEIEALDRDGSKDIEATNQKRRAVNKTPEARSSIPPQTEAEHVESHLQIPDPLEPPEPTVQEAPETNHRNNDPENETGNLFLELPFFPPSPEPEEEGPEQDIDEWIDDLLRTGKAQNEAQVIEALRCTSMDPRLANEALGHLVKEKRIPDGIPGIWTSEDDRCLESDNARDIERMLNKHGAGFFNARWEYLGMARTAVLEDTGPWESGEAFKAYRRIETGE